MLKAFVTWIAIVVASDLGLAVRRHGLKWLKHTVLQSFLKPALVGLYRWGRGRVG